MKHTATSKRATFTEIGTPRIALLAAFLALLIQSACGAQGADGAAGGNSGSNVGSGGAQDIGVFRSILEAGNIPGPDTLDANGFFAEHVIDLPQPDCGESICLQASLAMASDWVDGDYERIVQVALNSPIDPSSLERKPMDLVVVVDSSGSMSSSNKMLYVIQGLHTLVDELEPGDRMALVRYSSDVEVLAGLEDEADATTLHEAIDSLYASGSTNLYEGLQTGLQMAADLHDQERQSRVILMSDGLPTVGVTDSSQILAMSDSFVSDGVGLTTIGVGLDFDVNLMRSLAERGSGNFYFLDDPSAIDEVFTEELDTFMVPIAQDVTIEVRTAEGYTIKNVTGATFWEAQSYGGNMWLPSVFLAARTTSTPPQEGRRGGGSKFYVELDPTDQTGQNSDLVEVRLTYHDAADGKTHEQVLRLSDPYGSESSDPYYEWTGMEKATAVFFLYKGLHRACEQAQWNYNYALGILMNLRDQAVAWNETAEDTDIADDIQLIDQFIANLQAWGAYPDYGYEDDYSCGTDGPCTGGMVMCSTMPSDASWYWLAWMGMALVGMRLRRRK